MSDSPINPINSVHQVDPGVRAQAELLARTAARTESPGQPEPAAKPATEAPSPANNTAHIALQFRIDNQTNQLTVFVVDRASKRVLRSIPANELYELQAGDLLKLTA